MYTPGFDCQHRGPQEGVRVRKGCPSRRTNIPIYRCELHGMCADSPVYQVGNLISDESVKSCVICPDWQIDLDGDDNPGG